MIAPFTPQQIVWLSILATSGLVTMWLVFWWTVGRDVSVYRIIQSQGFFRTVAVIALLGFLATTCVVSAQVPDVGAGTPTGICIMPTYLGGDGKPHPCTSAPTAAPSVSATSPALEGAANFGAALGTVLGQQLHKAIYGDPAAKAAAAAAAAEAEREQAAELARQQALAEQQRQAMFDSLSHELKMSGFGDLSLKGFDNNSELQLKDFGNTAANTGGDMQLKGFGNQPPAADTAAASTTLGPQTCFFGECGPTDSGPLEAWNDPKVVDLRDLQQGVDLATAATKAPPAERQAIMDQALAAANGDQSIHITLPTDSAVPVTNEQGLLAFQQANNAYRQAHESAYQLQQAYNQMEAQRQGVYAVIKLYEDQLQTDLQTHMDEMSLAQQEAALAQIFDAGIQLHSAYGNTWSQYLAARQQYYQYQYQMQMYLWNTALGKQGNPPSPQRQLAQATADLPRSPESHPGPPDSDLSLVLPPVQPVVPPTKQDLIFLQQIDLKGAGLSPDPITQKVLDYLEQEQSQEDISNRLTDGAIEDLQHQQEAATRLSAQAPQYFPPTIVNQYKANPQFQQQMNAERQTIMTTQQQSVESAVQEADQQWQQKLSQLQSQGLLQPGVPVAQQAQNNPQMAAQLTAAQKLVTADLDYKVMGAKYQATRQWQQWIEQQEANLPKPTLTAVEGARD
jgi:hypothetical protein